MFPEKLQNDWITKAKELIGQVGMGKVLLIALCGVILILLSLPEAKWGNGGSGQKRQNAAENELAGATSNSAKGQHDTDSYKSKMESELEEMLENVDGISRVKVMITLSASEESVVLKDSPYSQESTSQISDGGQTNSSGISSEETTVLTQNQDGSTSPYVLKVEQPQVEGILVIADGVENAERITEITEAAQALFGIPVHKIKVMKRGNQTKS